MRLSADGRDLVVEGFSDPWEHVRLLSDRRRNKAMLDLLARRAPGARVLEVGCGTGLLSLVAARMGAKKVYAVEPTDLCEVARALVRHNDLEDQVEVLQGLVQDVEAREVDFAFSELLNADPFLEGILPAMDAARSWVAKAGMLSPLRLRVRAALVRAIGSGEEASIAIDEIRQLGRQFELDLDPVVETIADAGTYRYHEEVPALLGPAVTLWDIPIGRGWQPDDETAIELPAGEDGVAGGAVVWFEAELDRGLWLTNRPGEGGHWGQLVCGWAQPVRVKVGGHVSVVAEVDGDEIAISRA